MKKNAVENVDLDIGFVMRYLNAHEDFRFA